MSIPLGPLIALIAGILILIQPRLLSYLVAIYLIPESASWHAINGVTH